MESGFEDPAKKKLKVGEWSGPVEKVGGVVGADSRGDGGSGSMARDGGSGWRGAVSSGGAGGWRGAVSSGGAGGSRGAVSSGGGGGSCGGGSFGGAAAVVDNAVVIPVQQVVEEEEDLDHFYDEYVADDDDGVEHEYMPGDELWDGNRLSFKEKEEEKIRMGGVRYYYNMNLKMYQCPYYKGKGKPSSGYYEDMLVHLRGASKSCLESEKSKAKHATLLDLLTPKP